MIKEISYKDIRPTLQISQQDQWESISCIWMQSLLVHFYPTFMEILLQVINKNHLKTNVSPTISKYVVNYTYFTKTNFRAYGRIKQFAVSYINQVTQFKYCNFEIMSPNKYVRNKHYSKDVQKRERYKGVRVHYYPTKLRKQRICTYSK